MRTQKQKPQRGWATAVVAATILALLLLAGLAWLSQLTQDSPAEEAVPAAPAAVNDWTFFGKFVVPDLGQEWEETDNVPGWHDQTDCALEADKCPVIYLDDLDNITDPHSALGSMEGHPVEIEATRFCPVDFDQIREVLDHKVVEVGGKAADFYTLATCPMSDWMWEGSHYWWLVEEKGVLISAADTNVDTVNLAVASDVFEQSTWLS